MTKHPPPARGFLYAATGARYVQMAINSARALRRYHPDMPIDLFTDADLSDPVFDAVHHVGTTTRPKMAALRDSRFERSLFLDADTLPVAKIGDAFDILDKFDLALAHDPLRNSVPARRIWGGTAPASFPQVNTGIVALRKTPATTDLMTRWEAAFHDHGTGVDQPALRELLWLDRSLTLGILPMEFNFWDHRLLDAMDPLYAAPRVLHSYMFGRPKVLAAADINADTDEAILRAALGEARYSRLHALLALDGTPKDKADMAPPVAQSGFDPSTRARIRRGRLVDIIRKVPRKLGLK